jgi:competence protein ComFC
MVFLDILYPRKCLGCGRDGKYICNVCIEKVEFADNICPICLRASIDGMTHSKCLKAWGLSGCFALWRYEGVVRKALLSMKYKFAAEVAKELGFYTFGRLKDEGVFSKKGILVSIPMHKRRKNWRGFNQVEEISKDVANYMKWVCYPNLLIRIKEIPPQTELNREQRRKNVRGVFKIRSNFNPSLKEERIIIFDDVWTTGSTIKKAGKVLKRNGFKDVWGLTIARS